MTTPDAQAETPLCADPRDCCRELTRVWKALGISNYTGKSASEEVAALQARLQPKAETPDRIAEMRQREQAERTKAMATIAQCLSPENQNVVNGDLVGSVRDMAQVYVSAKDNAEEAMRQLEAAEAHIGILRDERDGQARAAQREFARANKAEALVTTLQQSNDAAEGRVLALREALTECLGVLRRVTQFDHAELHRIDTDEEPENCVACKSRAAIFAVWDALASPPLGGEA